AIAVAPVVAIVPVAPVAPVAPVVAVVAEAEALVAAPLPAEDGVPLAAPAERRPVAALPLLDPRTPLVPALRVRLIRYHHDHQARRQREHRHLLHTTSRLLVLLPATACSVTWWLCEVNRRAATCGR